MTKRVRLPFSKKRARKYAEKILSVTGKNRRICIFFMSDPMMRAMNRRYIGRDRATDVLAFETGDIAVSVDTAKKNARRFGASLCNELKLCMVHGILHLSGYDDTTTAQRKRMKAMEERILLKL